MDGVSPVADERIADVQLDEDYLTLELADGRLITTPLSWYPVLEAATPEQRANWQISEGGFGLHWAGLDLGVSTDDLLRGIPPPTPE